MRRLAAIGLVLSGAAEAAPVVEACRPLVLEISGTGEVVVGAEDITIDQTKGIAYISGYDRFAVEREADKGTVVTEGGIYALDMRRQDWPDAGRVRVADLTAEFGRDRQIRPHGISLFTDAAGRQSLFAVNRPYDGDTVKPVVEMFDVRDGALQHRATVSDAAICSPNDVAALDHDRFFVTNDHGACAGFSRLWEDLWGLRRSYVVYYDGKSARRVAEGIAYANGIAIGPPGEANGRLFVSGVRDEAVLIFEIAQLLTADAPVRAPLKRIDFGTGVDNLEWAPTGGLLVGAHSSLWSFFRYRQRWSETSPSQILHASPSGRVAEIFGSDGGDLSASSVAAIHEGVMLIGSVFEPHILACRLGP